VGRDDGSDGRGNLKSVLVRRIIAIARVPKKMAVAVREALEDGCPSRRELMKLYIRQMPSEGQVLLAGDHTAWPRLYARTLKDRTYEHSTRAVGEKPITVGHGYSTLAWIPEEKGIWALPPDYLYPSSGHKDNK
jgi:hypothetical protein